MEVSGYTLPYRYIWQGYTHIRNTRNTELIAAEWGKAGIVNGTLMQRASTYAQFPEGPVCATRHNWTKCMCAERSSLSLIFFYFLVATERMAKGVHRKCEKYKIMKSSIQRNNNKRKNSKRRRRRIRGEELWAPLEPGKNLYIIRNDKNDNATQTTTESAQWQQQRQQPEQEQWAYPLLSSIQYRHIHACSGVSHAHKKQWQNLKSCDIVRRHPKIFFYRKR